MPLRVRGAQAQPAVAHRVSEIGLFWHSPCNYTGRERQFTMSARRYRSGLVLFLALAAGLSFGVALTLGAAGLVVR
jgi:hypothetical protein